MRYSRKCETREILHDKFMSFFFMVSYEKTPPWSYMVVLQLPVQSMPLDQGDVYNIMWWSLSVTCDRSVVFSQFSGFLHQ